MKKQKAKRVFKLGTYLSNFKFPLIFGPVCKIFETAGDIISPYLMAKMIDVGIKNADKPYIIKIGIVIFVINIISFFMTVIAQKCASVSQEGIGRQLRYDLFQQINSYSHAELDKFSTASLTNRVVQDVAQIKMSVGMTLRNMTRAPLLLIGSLIMAIFIDPKLSLIFLAVIPLILLSVFGVMAKSAPYYDQTQKKLDEVTNISRDNLDGVRVVRAFNKQSYEVSRFEKSNISFTKVNIRVAQIASLLQPLIFIIGNFGVAAIIWFGGIQVNEGIMSQGNILAFVDYFTSISMSLIMIARLIIIYTRTGASIKRIDDVFATKNTITNARRKLSPKNDEIDGKVEFKNVSFSYNATKDAITELSFIAEPGNVIGIIGGTGSGKSSIVNLIPRFYDVTKGEVLIDDINVKKYDLESLRRFVGIVPQNPILFEGSLRENMQWHKADATDEEIIRALKIAQAYDFVAELPDFLDHKVYRGGTNFSGGQKQRLTIARALVGDPKILILDDSSSALDFATDAALRKAIKKMLSTTTVFLVSQRTTTIKDATNIIVIDNGIVVDIADHETLLGRCPLYAEIHYSQTKEKEGA